MTAPWRSPTTSTDSLREPLDPRLRLRWNEAESVATVVRAETGEAIGLIYQLVRWNLPGWANSWSEAVFVSPNVAANALVRETTAEGP